MLKVLHVIRSYGRGGGERQLALYLAASGGRESDGVADRVVTLYRDPGMAELVAESAPWVEIESLDTRWLEPGGAYRELSRLLPRLPAMAGRLAAILRDAAPHVCVVHGFQGAVVASLVMRRHRAVRWIYVHRTTKRETWAGPVFRWLYGPYDAVAAVSESAARSLTPYVPSGRVRVLPNGVDLARFECGSAPGSGGGGRRVVITTGRLVEGKGLELLMDAFETILRRRSDVEFRIVGDGPRRGWLEARIRASCRPDRIGLLGFRRDVPRLLSEADVFVFASENEGLSNAVLEAMAAGLPSVVVDAPGVSECHVPGETGLVVRRDARHLADAIERLLDDDALRRRLGDRARRRVRDDYSIGRSRERYVSLFRELVGRAGCAAS